MSGQIQIHTLSAREVLRGVHQAGWDDSVCAIRLTPAQCCALASNPALQGLDSPMQIIAVRGNRVIGRINFVAGDVCLRANKVPQILKVPVLWGSSLFVPPEERRSMAGTLIMMRMATVASTVGANGPSQMALPMYARLGFAALPLERFILLRRSQSVVNRFVPNAAVRAGARVVADVGLSCVRTVNAIRGVLASIRIRRLSSMPSEFELALAEPPPDYHPNGGAGVLPRAWGLRSVAVVDWWLANKLTTEGRHERALYLVESREGTPIGYILMKLKFYTTASHHNIPNITLATLADGRVFQPKLRDTLGSIVSHRALIHAAIMAAGQLSADGLEVCVQRDKADTTFMKSLGFIRAGTMTCMIKASVGSPLHGPAFPNETSWNVQYAEGDNVLS